VARLFFALAILTLVGCDDRRSAIQDVRTKDMSDMLPEMALIPAGTFVMGSPESEPDRHPEREPQRTESVKEFYLGKYEITVRQYEKFADATSFKTEREIERDRSTWQDPTGGKWTQTLDHPAICISWEAANEYCQWLSKETGDHYRLPTEIEWEYACRAGTTTAFHVGDTLSRSDANFANYNGALKGPAMFQAIPLGTTRVGSYKANAFGLFDMHGNAFEWCADLSVNEGYAASRGYHIIRGGAWTMTESGYCRSAYREPFEGGNEMMGFRVVRDVSPSAR
jgi:formylglycine-generating enzyme required for sulfatase activity